MDAKSINPFLDAAKSVLEQLGVEDIKPAGVVKKDAMLMETEITSIIGVVGKLRGNVAYSMSEDTAKKIISIMMMGMPVEAIDDMAKSAIGELTNMITGNAAGLLEKNGYEVDITPPSIVTGRDMHFVISKVQTIAVHIDTSAGKIEVNIGLQS